MKTHISAKFFGVLALAVAASGIAAAVTGGSSVASAASGNTTVICENGDSITEPGVVIYNIEARDGYISEPDGNTVYTWSYALEGAPFQFPGPTLCIDQGATVRINFTNPAHVDNFGGGIPVDLTSIALPGQVGVTVTGGQPGLLTQEVAPDDGVGPDEMVSYEFLASAPGTYLYESGTDEAVQIQMGMFGGLIVYPTQGRGYAYPGQAFDTEDEYLLIFHEMDPNLHTGIELLAASGATGDAVLGEYQPLDRHNRYWTINGRSFPDVIAPNNTPVLPSQPYGALVQVNAFDPDNADFQQLPALVRYANAGLDNHPFHPHGNTLQLIAQDARPFPDQVEAYTKTVAAGQTYDLLASWGDVEAWQDNGGPVGINIPALDNLVFKGGVTFYSGSPVLGQKGQLPSDVSGYSVCGEYYFPWHSHALDETQNFDEGFGGMLTLWRVDPPKVEEPLGSGNWVTPTACR